MRFDLDNTKRNEMHHLFPSLFVPFFLNRFCVCVCVCLDTINNSQISLTFIIFKHFLNKNSVCTSTYLGSRTLKCWNEG